MRERDYAWEALAEVTNTDSEVGRGKLNAALRDIRTQEPALASTDNSYLLSAEIHERAKMYRQAYPEIALTPNALAKHWQRVKAESRKVRGQNLHAGGTSSLPPLHAERLAEVTKLKETLWPST